MNCPALLRTSITTLFLLVIAAKAEAQITMRSCVDVDRNQLCNASDFPLSAIERYNNSGPLAVRTYSVALSGNPSIPANSNIIIGETLRYWVTNELGSFPEPVDSMSISTGGSIFLNKAPRITPVGTAALGFPGYSLLFVSAGEKLSIGRSVSFQSKQLLNLNAGTGMTVGRGVLMDAAADALRIKTAAGDINFGESGRIYGSTIDIKAAKGNVLFKRGSRLLTRTIGDGSEGISIVGVNIDADKLRVTGGTPVVIRGKLDGDATPDGRIRINGSVIHGPKGAAAASSLLDICADTIDLGDTGGYQATFHSVDICE